MRARVFLLLVLLVAPALPGAAAAQPGEEELLLTADTWPVPEATEQALDARGVEVLERFAVAQTLLVRAPSTGVAQLERLPSITHVAPEETHALNLASSKPAVRLTSEMHRAGLTGQGVNVALVDSGIDPDHPGLEDRLLAQYVVGDDGIEQGNAGASKHGTHVAGIIAGTGTGASQARGDTAGMAPGAGLISLDISQQFTTSNALRAFEWIYENHEDENIRIVANAWGRQRSPAAYEADDPVIRASDALVEEGLVVVFSAGNGGSDDSHMTLEGTNPNVITVGASDDEGHVESYSSRGPVYEDGQEANWTKPDLVAPGTHIVSARSDPAPGASPYVMMNGTSMAAPHVAGAAALLVSLRPDLTPSQVKGLLVQSARDIGPEGVDDASGAGMLDVSAAIQLLEQAGTRVEERTETTTKQGRLTGPSQAGTALKAASVSHEDAFDVPVPPNGTQLDATVTWDGRSRLEVRVYDPQGDKVRTAVVSGEHTVRLEDPAPGTWRIEVEPMGAARGEYSAEVQVTWLTHHEGAQIPIAEQRTRSGSFPSTGPGLDPFDEAWIPGVPNLVPMLAGGALTAVMVVGKLRGKDEDDGPPPDATFEPVQRG